MCGFVVLCQKGRTFPRSFVNSLEAGITHRGPDTGGQLTESGIAMAFRRLAILDPGSIADQPMTELTGRYSVVFNGEIYNFKELRTELEEIGCRFRTKSDTEVILQGYAEWRKALFKKLEGMFSLVIFDRKERKLIAARDTLGIKPLYVLQQSKLFGFASEIRSFSGLTPFQVDPLAISELLMFRFASGGRSNISNIELLPGGCTLSVALEKEEAKVTRFDDVLESMEPDNTLGFQDAVDISKEAITNSVKQHLMSDVGYAVQLSGGVDSSLISAIAAKETSGQLTSYGIHIPDYELDERPYRNAVTNHLKLRHTEVSLDNSDFANALPRAVHHMEGPVPHYGCVMLMLLCDRIKNEHKVVLTGEGADELFGGYKRYGIWRRLKRSGFYANLVPNLIWPFLRRWREIQKYSGRHPAIFASVYHDFLALAELFPDLTLTPGNRASTASLFEGFRQKMFAVDQNHYLPSLLMRQDKMAMAASVEARVPFAHMPLAKVINKIPVNIRAPGGVTKPVLKAVANEFLPSEIINRRKIGLALPLKRWLRDENGLGRYLDLLSQPDSKLAQYSNTRKLNKAITSFRSGKESLSIPLEHLINMELWLRSVDSTDSKKLRNV